MHVFPGCCLGPSFFTNGSVPLPSFPQEAHSHPHANTNTHAFIPTDGRANVPLSKSIDIEPIGADEALAEMAGEDGKPKKKDKEAEKKEREAIKVRMHGCVS